MEMNIFGITEEELNANLEDNPSFLEIEQENFFEEQQVETEEINLSPNSSAFFIKSLFCNNSSAIYLSSFINYFKNLLTSTIGKPIRYSTNSHAVTLYILKMLEKNGIVKIIESTPINRQKGNAPIFNKNRPTIAMYDILFYKMRDIQESDIELLTKIEKTLKIEKRQLKFKTSRSPLIIKLGFLEIFKCIFNGHIFIQLKKNLSSWKKKDGFKEEIDNMIYDLKNKRQPTIK